MGPNAASRTAASTFGYSSAKRCCRAKRPARIQFQVAAPSLFLLPSDLDGPAPPAGLERVRAPCGRGPVGRPGSAGIIRVQDQLGQSCRIHFPARGLAANGPLQCGHVRQSVYGDLRRPAGRGAEAGDTSRLDDVAAAVSQFRDAPDLGDQSHRQHRSGPRRDQVVRAAQQGAGAWSIFQQGTHAPDATHRFMGSIAMDEAGNIALGFTASSASVFPSLRVATRTPSDPPGTLPSEITLKAGSARRRQLSPAGVTTPRWMSIPVGDARSGIRANIIRRHRPRTGIPRAWPSRCHPAERPLPPPWNTARIVRATISRTSICRPAALRQTAKGPASRTQAARHGPSFAPAGKVDPALLAEESGACAGRRLLLRVRAKTSEAEPGRAEAAVAPTASSHEYRDNGVHRARLSWPGLSRPSTSLRKQSRRDARH